jgi:hypothetical protein
LTGTEIRQIAGRAGRGDAIGRVTTVSPDDLGLVHEHLYETPDPLTTAYLYPSFDQIKAVADRIGSRSYSTVLKTFIQLARIDGRY